METERTRPKWPIVSIAVIVFFSLFIDYFTKRWAEENFLIDSSASDFYQYESKQLPFVAVGNEESPEGSFLSLSFNYVRNFGAAWGIFSNLSDNIRVPFLALVTIASIFFLCFYFRSIPPKNYWARFAIILIISGAIGNFLNRIIRGYVIDWIDVRWRVFGWSYSFPNFNWADICISTGLILLLISSIVATKSAARNF